MGDGEKNLYDHQYLRFFRNRVKGKGYDFQRAPVGNVPPPLVTFRQKLRWWTWDRWKRRKAILKERDRRLQEILELRNSTIPPPE